MQSPLYEPDSFKMLNEMNEIRCLEINKLFEKPHEGFFSLMGKHPIDVSFEAMCRIWRISAKHITNVYKRVALGRQLTFVPEADDFPCSKISK